MRKLNFIFIQWEISRELWDSFPWWEKLRAIICFRLILPKARLVIVDKTKFKKEHNENI